MAKIALFGSFVVFAILLNSVGTVILQVQNTYDISESDAGVLEAFKDIPIAITSFFLTAWISVLGYRRAILVALLAVGATCLVMPSLPFFWMTKVLFAVTGVGFALVKVSALATVGLLTRSETEHSRFMNRLEATFMVGIAAGYFLFSAVIDDSNPASTGWLSVYYFLALLSWAMAILVYFAALDDKPAATEKPGVATDLRSALRALARPLMAVFAVSVLLYVLIEQSIMSWLPSFNSNTLNLAASLSVQMASILAVSTAVGRFLASSALRVIGWLPLLIGCLIGASVLVLVTLPLASSVTGEPIVSWRMAPVAAFVFPLIGLCLGPIYPTINSVVLSSLDVRIHGAAAALIVVFSALGGSLGSIVTGHLFELVGGQQAFYYSLVPIAVLAFVLVMLFVLISGQRKTAREQAT